MQKGGHYTDLPDSFILFFCSFDYLNSNLPVYTFKTICSEDKTIALQDGITKVIINSTAANKATDPNLKNFLGYMNGIMSDSPLIRKIDMYKQKNGERRLNPKPPRQTIQLLQNGQPKPLPKKKKNARSA